MFRTLADLLFAVSPLSSVILLRFTPFLDLSPADISPENRISKKKKEKKKDTDVLNYQKMGSLFRKIINKDKYKDDLCLQPSYSNEILKIDHFPFEHINILKTQPNTNWL